ncbi:MAG: hypothetical protein NTU61_02540, partial [Candidatus Altiarchaeota archaeon]|nr:hypothetical protein [Candidatus Altiarchaeota archaeon]
MPLRVRDEWVKSTQGEFHDIPLKSAREVALGKAEGTSWSSRDIPKLVKEKGDAIYPLEDNPHANRVLFMLSSAGEHIFARGIGGTDG